MARGDMIGENLTFGASTEILNRPPYEAVSMTIDFTSSGYTTENGENVMKAGMPIDKDGKAVSTTPFTGAVGILLYDVYEHRPQGAILTEAYVNTTRAQTNASVEYDDELVSVLNAAGCRIRFEDPFVSLGE